MHEWSRDQDFGSRIWSKFSIYMHLSHSIVYLCISFNLCFCFSRSSDGRLLVVSSTDGYCSFVKFDDGELGQPVTFDPIEYQDTQLKIRAAQRKEERKEAKKKESELKRKEKEAKKAEEKANATMPSSSTPSVPNGSGTTDKQPDDKSSNENESKNNKYNLYCFV